MTTNDEDIKRCLKEIAMAEARKKEEEAYIKECRDYLAQLLGLDLNNPINQKVEAGDYKVSISLDPTVKVDEKALASIDWRAYAGSIIKTEHKISGANWRKLSEEDRKNLSGVVTVKYNQPTYKVEKINKETN